MPPPISSPLVPPLALSPTSPQAKHHADFALRYVEGNPNIKTGIYTSGLSLIADAHKKLDEVDSDLNKLITQARVVRPGAIGKTRKTDPHFGKKSVRYTPL